MRLLQVAPKECPTGAALELQFTTRCSTCAAASDQVRWGVALGKRVHFWFDLGMSQDHRHTTWIQNDYNRHLWIHPTICKIPSPHVLVSMPSLCCKIGIFLGWQSPSQWEMLKHVFFAEKCWRAQNPQALGFRVSMFPYMLIWWSLR